MQTVHTGMFFPAVFMETLPLSAPGFTRTCSGGLQQESYALVGLINPAAVRLIYPCCILSQKDPKTKFYKIALDVKYILCARD